MNIKLKKRPQVVKRVLSDPDLDKNPYALKKKPLFSSRSEFINPSEKKRGLLTLQDAKLIHNINLQIPSLTNHNSLSVTNNPYSTSTKKSASIKGYNSKIVILSPTQLKKRKVNRESAKIQIAETEFGSQDEGEKDKNKNSFLSERLKKAIEENKKLKNNIEEDLSDDETIGSLMKNFKSRLYKLLYD